MTLCVVAKTPKTTRAVEGVAVLSAYAAFDLPIGKDGKRSAPSEFCVFPAGPFTTTKGIFLFSARSAADVMAAYAARGLPLMGDYEHQTDAEVMGFPPMISPASITEMTPEVRPGPNGQPELWVRDVQWTDRARAMLESGEYRLFSPVFTHTPDGEITSLIRIALTNKPAIDGLQPLVAATIAEEEKPMGTETCAACAAKDQLLSELNAKLTALTAEKETLTAKLKEFGDWAEEEKKEHEMTATALTDVTGRKTLSEQLGVLAAHKAASAELATLKAQVEAANVAKLTAEYNGAADAAVRAGKLPPVMKSKLDQIAQDKGISEAMSFLSAFTSTATSVVTLATSATDEPVSPGSFTTTQLEIAQRCGKSPEWAAKNLQPIGR